jgi:transposase InsO family protein
MAPRVAATQGARRARRQAPRRACDAAERHPGAWQAAFSRFDHRQQPCLTHCTEPACAQLHRGSANTVWTGDMTYIPTREGWLYLAVVLDLFSP